MTPKIEVSGDKLTVFRFSPEKGAQVPLISVSLNPSGVPSLHPSEDGPQSRGLAPKGPYIHMGGKEGCSWAA